MICRITHVRSSDAQRFDLHGICNTTNVRGTRRELPSPFTTPTLPNVATPFLSYVLRFADPLAPQLLQSRRNQLPLRTQEAPEQASRTRPDQGSHTACQSEGNMAGRLHRWCRHPDTHLHLPVCPPVPPL